MKGEEDLFLLLFLKIIANKFHKEFGFVHVVSK
jgi:hypothetical protein